MGTALSELLAQAAYGKSAWKLACRTVATSNVTLSGLQTIGGVALAVGDRLLVTGQTNAAQNGPYTVSSGAWSRGIDFDAASDVQYGSRFAITDGTAAGQVWMMTSPTSGPIALGATLLTFAQLTSGGWQTAIDLDFSAQSAQTFATNGTYTIAGKTFTKGNSINDAAAPAIVPGQGLRFNPASTSNYDGSSRSMPYLWTPLSGILPSNVDFGWSSRFRLFISVGNNNISTIYDNFVNGLDTNSTSWGIVIKQGYGTGGVNPTTAVFWVIGGQGGSTAGNGTGFLNGFSSYSLGPAGVRTFCYEFAPMAPSGPTFTSIAEYIASPLSVGSAFPGIKTFHPAVVNTLRSPLSQQSNWATAAQGFGTFASPYMAGGPWNNLGILLGMQRAGSGTALEGIYQRIRLDYLV